MKVVVDALFVKKNLDVKYIISFRKTREVIYVFGIDGVDISFEGKLRKNGDIKGIEYGDKLESFLMNFMPVDRDVSKNYLY